MTSVQTLTSPSGMDPNLATMRDANIHLVKQGKLAKTIVQAKDYLVYILGENQMARVNNELDVFVDHLYDIAGDNAPIRKVRRGRKTETDGQEKHTQN